MPRLLGQCDAGGLLAMHVVEQAQLDAGGVLSEEGEVRALAIPGAPSGSGSTGQIVSGGISLWSGQLRLVRHL